MVNRFPGAITAAQLRAARGWLKWSQDDLAERSGVSKSSIVQFELGRSVPYSETIDTLRQTLETAGIEFLFNGNVAKGIRIR